MDGKLLLVEDQTYFRKGLLKMITDHSLGWTVVGEAENGQEALRLVEELKPHLVLTDIRMPVMDGLELARQLQLRESKPEVVILTGYDDFKYAQAAIRYGVVDFLLKPCNEEALMEVLDKAGERLRVLSRQQEEREADRRLKDGALLRGLLLRLPGIAEAEDRLKELIEGKKLLLVGVENYFPQGRQYQEKDLGLLQFALFNIVHELVGDARSGGAQLHALEFNRFVLLLEPEEDGVKLADTIRQTVDNFLGLPVTAAASPPVRSVLMDPPSFYDAWFKDGGPDRSNAHTADPPGGVQEKGNRARVKELQTRMTGLVLLGQTEKVEELLKELLSGIGAMEPEDAKMEALALAFALASVSRQQFEAETEADAVAGRIDALQSLKTGEEARHWATAAADGFLRAYRTWRTGKNENIINRTLEYLDKHYMEPCSVSDMAAMLHISPTYFSKLFKKETGDNYSAYLTKLRMQKAVLLLLNTEMKVFEIASAVGYDDPNYFTNVFRMLHGMSPSDYRKNRTE